MALKNKSLFLYGFQITPNNSSLDFKAASGGPVLTATLRLGFYSLSGLVSEVVRSMQLVDPANLYTGSVDRTVNGGLENRVTISTASSYLSLLFGTGPRVNTSVALILGFNTLDYTGSTSYVSSVTSGTPLIPTFVLYNYLGPEINHKVFGSVNVSASGKKEAIVFGIQSFIQLQIKHEPYSRIVNEYQPFFDWMIQQRFFEFTPDITAPSTVYEVSLEQTSADGKGMAYKHSEQLPSLIGLYDIGKLKLRVNVP